MKLLLLVALVAATLTAAVSSFSATAMTTQKLGSGATASPKLIWGAPIGGMSDGSNPLLNAAKGWLYVNGGSFVAILDAATGSNVRQTFSPGSLGDSGFVRVGNKIYSNAEDSVFCRSSTDFSEIWRYHAPVTGGYGFSSTPLYVASHNAIFAADSTLVILYKLDATSGKKIWGVSFTLDKLCLSAQPKYSAKYDLVICWGNNQVAATDATNGTLAWQHQSSQPSIEGQGAVFSEDKESIIFANGASHVYSLAVATGKLLWTYVAEGAEGILSPAVANGVVFAADVDFSFYAIHAASGKGIWRHTNARSTNGCANGGSPRIYGDTVIFGTDDGLVAMAQNGSGIAWQWSQSPYRGTFGGLSVPTADGKIYLTSDEPGVYALQLPSSGEKN